MSRDSVSDPSPASPSDASESPAALLEPAEEPLLVGPDRSLSVLVVGASGFVGLHVVDRLASRGHAVRAASRRGAPFGEATGPEVAWVTCDVTRPDRVAGLARDCDVVVNLAGIRREEGRQTFRGVHVEGTVNLLRECREAGVERFVLASVLGAGVLDDPFHRSKREAEAAVRDAGLDGVIFRPAVIFGPGDHFVYPASRWLRSSPVLCVPGSRNAHLRPVAIEDVTDALCQAVERPDMADSMFHVVGPERIRLRDCYRTVAEVLGLRRLILAVPPALIPLLRGLARIGGPELTPVEDGWDLYFTATEPALLSGTGNALRAVFHVEPMPFRAALEDYL